MDSKDNPLLSVVDLEALGRWIDDAVPVVGKEGTYIVDVIVLEAARNWLEHELLAATRAWVDARRLPDGWLDRTRPRIPS